MEINILYYFEQNSSYEDYKKYTVFINNAQYCNSERENQYKNPVKLLISSC